MTPAVLSSEIRELYKSGSARIQQQFATTGDGRSAVVQRTALVDGIAARLWEDLLQPHVVEQGEFALVAIGGYGRASLFPYSDVDLLFLHTNSDAEEKLKDPIRAFSQELWDLGIKLSPASRTLAECDRFDPNNVEAAIALLDCRFLAGSRELFLQLHDHVVTRLTVRDGQSMVQRLVEITRNRHARQGGTVFHLEPNVKDAPGGLRDYNVAHWLGLIAALNKLQSWPEPEQVLPASMRRHVDAALEFLVAVRCFLHFRHKRDDNSLTWTAQDEAASRNIGVSSQAPLAPADWMRIYFQHARAVHRICRQLLDEVPAAWSSLYRQFQSWRSRISTSEFSVVQGMVFLPQAAAVQDPETLLRLFHFVAHHGVKLSTTTEQRIEQALPAMAATPPRGTELWIYLQEILLQPHAAEALRSMHALRFLTMVLPELDAIDALVVRDFYHRFTVDEHTFLAIEGLHRLQDSSSEWDKRYAALLSEVEQPELLYLGLLLHDVGKGVPGQDHIASGLELAESCLDRLDLAPQERDTVRFLIAHHLAMSATLRRDIFDPETVRAFADLVKSPERLKMLCLLTYADIKAVNPEALTPWKAENIWQLYIETANHMNLSADQRLHEGSEDEDELLRTLSPVTGKKLKVFLEGLPRRYLALSGKDEVLRHLEMASRLKSGPVQVALERGRHWFNLTVVTADRPMLFASMTGVLTAWGMSIVKASAVSNTAGVVVDVFHFTDPYRTLELNLPEWERFKRSISDVLTGHADLEKMLRNRLRPGHEPATRTKIQTRLDFNDTASSASSVLQIIAQDRPGLLYRLSSTLSRAQCNIEIALIDTEGEMAIDVFYLTWKGKKLGIEQQESVRAALLEELKEI